MATASESYAVAAELMLKSNVPEALSAIISGFERMDAALRTSVEGFDRLASAGKRSADEIARAQVEGAERGARAQTTAADRTARSQEAAADRSARAQERAAARSVEAATRAAAVRAREEEAAGRRYDSVREAADRENMARDQRSRARYDRDYDMAQRANFDHDARARPSAAGGSHLSSMDVAVAAGATSGALGGLITSAGRAALEPAYVRSMLLTDRPDEGHEGVTPESADAAERAAWDATRSAPGTTFGKNMEAVSDLKNVTGSLSDAVRILPQFANLSAVLAVADRKAGGSGDQAFAAAKAMEVLGELTEERRNPTTGRMEQHVDPAQLPARLESMAKVAVATAGRVNPTDYLAFAKQARAGGMNLSDQFLYQKLPAMMMVMGASRAGTAVQSMSQVFQGGKLTNKSWREMSELGLAGDSREVTTGKGKSSRTEIVGKIFEQDLLAKDPAAWASRVHDHLINDLHMSEQDATNSVQRMAQRSTIAGFIADLMKDAAGILKEQSNIAHTDVTGLAESNPAGKINALHASFENLLAALGGPLVGPATSAMDSLTAVLNRVGDWAKANPSEAKILGEVAVGLFGLAAAVAAVSGALLVYGPVIAAARGLVGLASAASAGETVAATAGAAGVGLAGRAVAGILAGARAATPVGLAVGAAAATWSHLTPLTEDQARRLAPNLGAPQDGFDLSGRPVGPSAAPAHSDLPVTVRPSGTQDVRVTNTGDLARGYQANLGMVLSRPPSGPTGFDSTGSVPSHPSTSTP